MKIGILTFHYMINQGSVLQAYCVYKLLKKSLPEAEIEIINLIPANRGDNEKRFFRKRPPFLNFREISKYRSIRNFLESNVPLSPFCNSRILEEQIEFINNQNYTCIFTGSDTVWMHSEKLDNLLPHIYFLPQGIEANKFSIAASLDPIRDKSSYFNKKEELTALFKSYKYMTVRDQMTLDLITNLGVDTAKKIADPTLLFDFENDLNLTLNKSRNLRKKNVFIFVTDAQIHEELRSMLKDEGDFAFVSDKARVFGYDHMRDYLNEYEKVDILITDRFHRSIFGMKLSNALVINVERYNKNPLPESKGRDLFSSLGIPEYCLRYEKDSNKVIKSKLLALIEEWDTQKFEERERLLKNFIEKNKKVWGEMIQKVKELELRNLDVGIRASGK